ncbi:MAG: hypothetical protein M1839_002519 [Geoglossum umbratile]|nr:MAG: hypothetical protein M1839_002519 [Geoglossum umbratile]
MSVFASVLQSSSIRLLVGEDRKEYLVHRKVLERHLTDLHIPSRERFIEFDGDEESVGYMLEFLYTGNYSREDAAPQKSEPEPPLEEPVHPIILAARTSTLGVWGKPPALHTKYNHGKPAPKRRPTAVITNGIASPPASPPAHKKHDPAAHQSADIAGAFLVHAQVYLLAERYGANSLKELSLEKLRAALKAFELGQPIDRTAALIEFIKRVYNLPIASEGHCKEGRTRNRLRDVVVAHAVAYLPELQADPAFNAYIREGGDFVADLFTALAGVKVTRR